MIKAIIFDLDGTLVESAADLQAAANGMLAELGKPPIDIATITSFIGHGIEPLVAKCLKLHAIGDTALADSVERFKQIYQSQGYAQSRLFPGVARALTQLTRQGYQLGLCTNKDEGPARAILLNLGIADHFVVVVGGDTLAFRKPDPETLLGAARGCGADADEFLYVGDSEVDAETAHRAGAPFLLFTEGYRKAPIDALGARICFSDYDSLASIVESLQMKTDGLADAHARE